MGARRAWSVVFALGSAAAAAGLLGAAPHAQPVLLTAPEAGARVLLRAGDEAAAGGQYALADARYRQARKDPGARAEATLALRDLHRRVDFRLPVDQAGTDQTARVLGRDFKRYDTAHFVVMSDGPVAWSRAKAALLERTRAEFFRATDRLGLQAVPHAHKLVCVLVGDHATYRRLGRELDGLDAEWIAGYYSTGGNRVMFYNDATSPVFASARARLDEYEQRARATRDDAGKTAREDLARQLLASADELSARVRDERRRLEEQAAGYSTSKTIHECVHLLSFNTGVQRRDREYPLWLSEGLATAFETADPGRAFGPDRGVGARAEPLSRRARLLELVGRGAAPSLADLVGIGAAPRWDADTADAIYALSDALFAYLYRREPAALGTYLRVLGEEPPGEPNAARRMELFVAHFGDPAAVERRLLLELR